MKPILLGIIVWACSLNGFGQNAKFTSDHKLFVPAKGDTIAYKIRKADLKKVDYLVCKAGQVISYGIAFAYKGDLHMKTGCTGKFDPKLKGMLVTATAGTKFFLENIQIKSFKDSTVSKSYCLFVIKN